MPTIDFADNRPFTIGQLAKASSVGVETIRYYQRRGLLPGRNRRALRATTRPD